MLPAFARSILLSFVSVVSFIATSGHAQVTAPGPYYATPSWDQTFPAATRFIILSNFSSEAVLDRETGLVWQRTPTFSPRDWDSAIDTCWDTKIGGKNGWRLPQIEEGMSLAEGGILPTGHPFNLALPPSGGSPFWSANESPASDLGARGFQVFGNAVMAVFLANKTFEARPWCVRGPRGLTK